MNCKKCGSPLTPESKICNVCGADVEQPIVSNNQSVAESVGTPAFGSAQNNPQQSDIVSSSSVLQDASNTAQTSETKTDSVVSSVQNPVSSMQTTISPENPFLSSQSSNGFSQSPIAQSQSMFASSESSVENAQEAASSPISVNAVQDTGVSENVNLNANVGVANNGANDTSMQQPFNQETNQELVQTSNPVGEVSNVNVQTEAPVMNNQSQTVVGENLVGDANTTPVVNDAKPKKKSKLGLIIIVVFIILIVAYFVFQYVSLTNEANKIKNNNAAKNNTTNNSELQSNDSKNIVSENSYETIAHQDEYYVEYDFDYSNISTDYEKEYSIGKNKVNISMSSNKTGNLSINGKTQNVAYPIIKIYHLLKSDTLFIENKLLNNDSEIYVYTGTTLDNLKTNLTAVHYFDSINVGNNVLGFTGKAWKDNKVFNGDTQIDICQDNYTSYINDAYVVETIYSFDLQETVYSSDKLQSTTKKTIKELYSEVCSGTTTPTGVSTPSTSSTSQVNTTSAIN